MSGNFFLSSVCIYFLDPPLSKTFLKLNPSLFVYIFCVFSMFYSPPKKIFSTAQDYVPLYCKYDGMLDKTSCILDGLKKKSNFSSSLSRMSDSFINWAKRWQLIIREFYILKIYYAHRIQNVIMFSFGSKLSFILKNH